MKNERIDQLIKKVLAGEATREEIEKVEQWWTTPLTDRRDLASVSDEEWRELDREMQANLQQIIREDHFGERKKSLMKQNSPTPQHLTTSTPQHIWYAAAASLVFLVAAGIYLFTITGDKVIHTSYGERRIVTLPDNSTVVLNGNSSLRYSRDWTANEDRTVQLEGEAFFAVKHTEDHNRFIVKASGNLTIEVLGTQFNVTNRKGETNVVLQEGSVRLDDTGSSYIMKPNEMVSYSKKHPAFVSQMVVASQKISWKESTLIYKNEPLGSIIEKLSESHGLKVVFANAEMKAEVFNGSIPADSVEVLFEKIESLYGVSVTQDEEGVYTIH